MKSSALPAKRLLATVIAGSAVALGISVGTVPGKYFSTPTLSAPQVARADDDVLDRVADRIEKAFERDRYLKRYDLEADEDDGHIEIEGRVSRSGERDRAYNIARRHTPRRYRVINKIRVGGRR